MFDNVERIIINIQEVLQSLRNVWNLATGYVFKTNVDVTKLDVKKSGLFQYCITQIFYLSKQARSYFLTAVACLCTRLASTYVDDAKKVQHII